MLGVLGHRSRSMMWHSHIYPGRFALLLSPSAATKEAFLTTLKQDFAAWKGAEALDPKPAFWKNVCKNTPFQTTLVQEWASRLVQPGRPRGE
eukprot:7961356-Lingulodinium_polyedra.AAC.1